MVKASDPEQTGVWWTKTSQEPKFAGAVEPGSAYDLAVVGGGYCGLAIAMHAAMQGLKVVLLEAQTIGAGASGRNGGFVVPQFPGPIRPSDVRNWLGEKKGARLSEIVMNGPAAVFDMIREHQIQCHAMQKGWLQPAHSKASLECIRKVYEEWTALGAPLEWLDQDALTERLGVSGYLGGWLNPTGGNINPYALSQGMARVARQAGADIAEHARVTAISRSDNGHVLRGDTFETTARQVVIATNGYTEDLYPKLTRSVIPIRLYHVFTRPLTEEEQATVLPEGTCLTDTRASGGFTRYDSTGRILSGGAVLGVPDPRTYGERHCRWRLGQIFPQLAGIEFDKYWEGYCALTENTLPEVQVLDDGVYSVLGFSTRGVSLSQNLGRELARFFSGEIALDDVPVEVTSPRAIPLQPLKAFLGGYAFPVFQMRDRLGLS